MPFGLVLGADGKKFKTRSGENVKLFDLLDEARDRAKKDLESRMSKGGEEQGEKTNLQPEELEGFAERIGMAAVKYYDLRMARTSDYRFDYDKMLANNGTPFYIFRKHRRLLHLLIRSRLLHPEESSSQ